MNRRGIISVGNWLVDSIKFIDSYPARGNLSVIRRIEEGLGGCSHNVLVDLARLESGIPLYAGGCIGDDRFGRMVMQAIEDNGIDGANMTVLPGVPTSYTDVMSETGGAATRTFFHCCGANAELTPEMVLNADVPAKIFHLGYLLLLDKLDDDDPDYGVVAARVLDGLQQKGYKTSVDVVSEEGDRFRKVVLPCLRYTDYLIVNEVEAGACLGINLRNETGEIMWQDVEKAAVALLEKGVNELCVIHFPEGGVAVRKDGSSCLKESRTVPSSEIVSAVGAGDAFCAGCLYAIHEDYSLDRMLEFANASARFNLFSATSTGGAPPLNDIKRYLQM